MTQKANSIPLSASAATIENVDDFFAQPPPDTRPWVYMFWLEGNITKEGITADLEAMAAQGVGGLLFMDGALGNPSGPHRFMSESWREMFKHMLDEAARLGLQVNLNNDPGWAGSGGPWVRPEQATQRIVIAETVIEGPRHFSGDLPKPDGIKSGYYRDIAVVAYPLAAVNPGGLARIPGYGSTKSFAGKEDFAGVVPWPRFIEMKAEHASVEADQRVCAGEMRDLTPGLVGDKLNWDAPAGRWVVLRIGHTVSNGQLRSAQPEANGLESNKLSRAAMESHFEAMVGKLASEAGSLTGKTLVSIHVDSWESGSGNWTEGFRDEFRQRRGYDLLPFIATLNGIVVDDLGISERFLWDFRETITELLLENYAGYLRTLANQKGMRLSIEAFDGTADDLRYAGRADEPMSEYWQRPLYNGLPMCDLTEGMASAAHVYGRRIVGCEAFTGRWGDFLDHPATLKPLADWGFCAGVNRLYLSQWIMQPWPAVAPGVSFLDLGTVFSRAQTWWGHSRAWNEYVARCQYLLREGSFVADICFLTAEGAPSRFTPPLPADSRGAIPRRPRYNYDGCPPELVLNSMTVLDGRVVLPSGMSYQILVLPTYDAGGRPVIRQMHSKDYYYKPMPLPKVETMTPALLRRIKQLVEEGATVLGPRPLASPSLSGYPRCDEEVARLADELWGPDKGLTGAGERSLGKGRMIWGSTPEEVLAAMDVPPDFSCSDEVQEKLNYIHRRTDDGLELYFVVNMDDAPVRGDAFFRVSGKQPEWWHPQTGRTEKTAVFSSSDGITTIPLTLEAHESVFVIFRGSQEKHFLSVKPSGESISQTTLEKPDNADGTFFVSSWVKPGAAIRMPSETVGGWEYRPAAIVPAAGYQTFTSAGCNRRGIAVGSNGVVVFQYGRTGSIEPLLVYEAMLGSPDAPEEEPNVDPIMAAAYSKRIHVGAVHKNRKTHLFVEGKLVKESPASRFPNEDPGHWADERMMAGDLAALHRFYDILRATGHGALAPGLPIAERTSAVDTTHGVIWESGTYEYTTSDGAKQQRVIALPAPREICGPWTVEFDPRWGGPATCEFAKLVTWSEHPDERIRFYSGTAAYHASFNGCEVDHDFTRRIFLDLGDVAVAAKVTLNGQALGILWKAPYRLDITGVIDHGGENRLTVEVANLWVNRLIGDEHLPDDSPRERDGALKSWPQWVLEGAKSPTGRYTFASRRIWRKEDILVKSGLLGPVRVVIAARILTDLS